MNWKIPKTEELWTISYGKTEEFRKLTFLVTEEFKFSAMGIKWLAYCKQGSWLYSNTTWFLNIVLSNCFFTNSVSVVEYCIFFSNLFCPQLKLFLWHFKVYFNLKIYDDIAEEP